jgi:hypothetical protein
MHGARPKNAKGNMGSVFRQIPILKPEITLLPLAPRALPVEIYIDTLLVLFRDGLRFGVTLEPSQIFDVESPRLLLEFLRSKVPAKDGVRVDEDVELSRLTVDMCREGNRTRRIESPRPAARRFLQCSAPGVVPAGSRQTFDKDYVEHSSLAWSTTHDKPRTSGRRLTILTSPYLAVEGDSNSHPLAAYEPDRGLSCDGQLVISFQRGWREEFTKATHPFA